MGAGRRIRGREQGAGAVRVGPKDGKSASAACGLVHAAGEAVADILEHTSDTSLFFLA